MSCQARILVMGDGWECMVRLCPGDRAAVPTAKLQSRLRHGKSGTEIVTDPELHKALILMRAAGIPCDRMHPDDEEFGDYMKEPVP